MNNNAKINESINSTIIYNTINSKHSKIKRLNYNTFYVISKKIKFMIHKKLYKKIKNSRKDFGIKLIMNHKELIRL